MHTAFLLVDTNFLKVNTQMAELFRVIVDALNSKERTAKVYAASIRRIHRELYKKELEDKEFKFLAKRTTTYQKS